VSYGTRGAYEGGLSGLLLIMIQSMPTGFICSNLRQPGSNGNSILLVDDDPGAMQLLGSILVGVGDIRFATNGADAIRIARESVPDLILLDAEMPGMSGFKVLEALKAEPELATVPVIFVTSHSEAGFEVSALEMGAADYIGKPFKSTIVLARVKAQLTLKRTSDGLRQETLTDSLTGIANRRHFDRTLEREWLTAQRTRAPTSMLMIDVDYFKSFNDRYGHPKGDACLRQLAQALVSVARRPSDLVARCGGEEFVILLPNTPRRGAELVARHVLDAVAARAIFHRTSTTLRPHLTVSIGIASHDEESPCWPSHPAGPRADGDVAGNCHDGADLVLAADRALYAAKTAGRARAVLRDISAVHEIALEAVGPSPPVTH
jgi:diguanylate cyclase (GGDEF)-like protein